MTHAASHDGARLPDLLDQTNLARPVWADTAYRSARNERAMTRAAVKIGMVDLAANFSRHVRLEGRTAPA